MAGGLFAARVAAGTVLGGGPAALQTALQALARTPGAALAAAPGSAAVLHAHWAAWVHLQPGGALCVGTAAYGRAGPPLPAGLAMDWAAGGGAGGVRVAVAGVRPFVHQGEDGDMLSSGPWLLVREERERRESNRREKKKRRRRRRRRRRERGGG